MSLWAGLPPALARGFIYGGLRLGLYTPIKAALSPRPASDLAKISSGGVGTDNGSPSSLSSSTGGEAPQRPSLPPPPPLSFGGKLLAGSLSGGIAAAISNPTELVKTRLQTKGIEHQGSVAVIKHILQTEGVVGLWRGAVPG